MLKGGRVLEGELSRGGALNRIEPHMWRAKGVWHCDGSCAEWRSEIRKGWKSRELFV